jgi:hypothetical protein
MKNSTIQMNKFLPLPENLPHSWMNSKNIELIKEPDGFSWVSDVEHVVNEKNGDIFLADSDPAFYLCGAEIPGGKFFELFPYHYYDKSEEEFLGSKVNYKLIAKNITSSDIRLEIRGMGTTRDWDHFKTWEGAFQGNGAAVFYLKPGEAICLWEEKKLDGALPWSGVFLGIASGNLWICDYVYKGETDPGIENAKPIPDLSQPPVEWPAFTRGTANWNSADIKLFHGERTDKNRIRLGYVNPGTYSFAFADSPGGPESRPQLYAAVERTFKDDLFSVLDPVSKKSHLYFGGNYPVMYNLYIPLINDSTAKKTVSLNLSSNDKVEVDTIVGIWMNRKMYWCRVPMVGKNLPWRCMEFDLEPGEEGEIKMTIVPLGSRWGGIVATFCGS